MALPGAKEIFQGELMAESETKMDTHDLGKNRCQTTMSSGTRWNTKKEDM